MEKSLSELLTEVRRDIPASSTQRSAGSTSQIHEDVDLLLFSPIEPDARAIVARMLEGSPEESCYRAQVEGLVARPSCSCGCPSLALRVLPEHPRAHATQNMVSDMIGESEDGRVGLILWQAGGSLSELEIYDLAARDDGRRYKLPALDTLQPLNVA